MPAARPPAGRPPRPGGIRQPARTAGAPRRRGRVVVRSLRPRPPRPRPAGRLRQHRPQGLRPPRRPDPHLAGVDPEAVRPFRQATGGAEFQTEGTRVNTTGGWREVRLSVFARRDRGEPVADLAGWDGERVPAPRARVATAAIRAREALGPQWRRAAARLGVKCTAELTVLADGAKWIWNEAEKNLPRGGRRARLLPRRRALPRRGCGPARGRRPRRGTRAAAGPCRGPGRPGRRRSWRPKPGTSRTRPATWPRSWTTPHTGNG